MMSLSIDNFERALSLEKTGDYTSALEVLNTMLSSGNKGVHTYIAKGRILREMSELDASAQVFKEAMELEDLQDDMYIKNVLLNEFEISSGKIILNSRPRGMGVVLTTRCNLRCKMCNSYKTKWDIPISVVDEIYQNLPYLQRVLWLGGEAFLSEHFEKLFDKASENNNLHQTLVTHGLLIDEKWAKKLVHANMNLTCSIDSIKKDVYESIRIGGKFEELLKNLSILKQEKLKNPDSKMTSSINFVVMKSNYGEIETMIDFAKEYAFDDLTLTPVDYVEDEENIFKHKNIEAWSKIEPMLKNIRKKADSYGMSFHNWLPVISDKREKNSNNQDLGLNQEETTKLNPAVFCLWPWQNIFVDLDGQVKPFCHCPEKVGSVKINTLAQIWNNEKMQEYRTKILNNDFKNFCNKLCTDSAIARDCMGLSW